MRTARIQRSPPLRQKKKSCEGLFAYALFVDRPNGNNNEPGTKDQKAHVKNPETNTLPFPLLLRFSLEAIADHFKEKQCKLSSQNRFKTIPFPRRCSNTYTFLQDSGPSGDAPNGYRGTSHRLNTR